MKKGTNTKILIFAFIVSLFNSFNIFSESINNEFLSKNIYVVDGISGFNSVVVNDRNEILYKSNNEYESIDIINDIYLNKPSLIHVRREEENLNNYIVDDYGNMYDYESSLYKDYYYDLNGKEMVFPKKDFNNFTVFNNYAIKTNFDNISNKSNAIVYNIKDSIIKPVDFQLSDVRYENNYIFGIKYNYKYENNYYSLVEKDYFLLNENLEITKKLSSYEYEELNGKKYEKRLALKTWNGVEFFMGIKHDLKYIIDNNDNKITNGYECDDIGIANFTSEFYRYAPKNYSYDDFIFYRINGNNVTYFTLKGDLYTKEIDKMSDGNNLYGDTNSFNRKYDQNEKFVVGKNNCYAIIDTNTSKARIYNSTTGEGIATVSSLVDYRGNSNFEKKYQNVFYLDNMFVYGAFVLYDYYDPISEGLINAINTNENTYGVKILARNSINNTIPRRMVRQNKDEEIQRVIDVEKQVLIKNLNLKYNDSIAYENEGKYIIALRKENTIDNLYDDVYDLYDNDYKLLRSNVININQVNDIFSFEKIEMIDIKDIIKTRNTGKLFKTIPTIINFENKTIYEAKNDTEKPRTFTYKEKAFIEVRYYKKVNEDYKISYIELYDSKFNKLIDIKGIKGIDKQDNLYINTDNETYVYKYDDGKMKLIKKINMPLSLVYYKNRYKREYKDKINNLYVFINENTNLYYLLDNEYNFIGDSYKNIVLKEGYYYCVSNNKICIYDFNHNVKAILDY